jgi:hypothetical protein
MNCGDIAHTHFDIVFLYSLYNDTFRAFQYHFRLRTRFAEHGI